MPYRHFSNMIWKLPYKQNGIWKIENKCFAPLWFQVWGKRALFNLDLKSGLQAPFKYVLESARGKEIVFGLQKNKNVFRRDGFSCGEKHVLSKSDLEIALQGLFKYDLGSVLQMKNVFGLKKQKCFPSRWF